MHINDVALTTQHYPFALDAQNVAASLRRLADGIDDQTILPQSVRLSGFATTDDFVIQVLRFTFVEKLAENETREHIASFPVDVGRTDDDSVVELR